MKGGGKRPTHDYSTACVDIGHLSRVAVLIHVPIPGPNWLSPSVTSLDGTNTGSVHLLLHSEHVVLALDPICPTGIISKIPIMHNQDILEVSPQLMDTYASIQQMQQGIVRTAEAVLKAAGSRRKRQAPTDNDNADEDIAMDES